MILIGDGEVEAPQTETNLGWHHNIIFSDFITIRIALQNFTSFSLFNGKNGKERACGFTQFAFKHVKIFRNKYALKMDRLVELLDSCMCP